MEQRKPSFRPTPIIFNSKQEEEAFEKWAFSSVPNEQELSTQTRLNALRNNTMEFLDRDGNKVQIINTSNLQWGCKYFNKPSRGLEEVLMEVRSRLKDNFIVCMESSASMLGITNAGVLPLSIYTTENITIEDVEVYNVPSLNSLAVLDRKGIKITNEEQTIIDMLKEYADPQTITESMCYYYYSIGEEESWGRLPDLAKQNGVLEEFNSYTEDAIEHAFH